jgi:CheY-like chemotaxis protein
MNVFISYNSKNKDLADLVEMKLEKEDIQVWKDTNLIDPGTEWRREIDQSLLNCDVVIVLLSQLSTQSLYVTYEWAFALGNGKTIIPILTENCKIHPRIEILQYIDFTGSDYPWGKLIEKIKKIKKPNGIPKVSDLTVEELEKLISGSKNIASESAKKEGRIMQEKDITEVANRIVNAKSFLETQQIKNNTILWVDDRPENNIYERESLELIGFKFELALSTQEALQKLKSNKCVAIISDMGRVEGEREGYVLLKEVRKMNKSIPFFIYAGSNLLAHKIEAQEKGAQGSTNIATELIDLITFHVQPTEKQESLG